MATHVQLLTVPLGAAALAVLCLPRVFMAFFADWPVGVGNGAVLLLCCCSALFRRVWLWF